MTIRKILFASLLLALCLAGAPARAEHAVAADMTAEDRIELTRIEDYLNGVSTMKAGFTQTAASGTSSGTFYLSRPGHLRFDYAQPQNDIIVADGKLIWYYDAKLKDANHAPISRTLADFLLRQQISLTGGDITVTDYRNQDGAITVTMTQTDDPGQGSFTLVLNEHPLQIRQWRVVDSQGRATQVALRDPQFGLALDRDLFVWRDPEDK